jgi:DNA-binding GntR family transcriptional regulator
MIGATSVDPAGSVSKSRTAYDWLRQRITRRDFTPGYRLVLSTIANELDMSVVPVREAIRQLEAEGLVTFERNVGARVSMVDDTQYRHSMQALAVLEGVATALAAPLVTPEELAEARRVNEQMRSQLAYVDPPAFTALNQSFHALLFQRCPNPRLLELVNSEWARLGGLRTSTFSFVPERSRESVCEHEQIIELIERSAPLHEVEAAARAHRSATLQAYLSHEHPGEVDDLASI